MGRTLLALLATVAFSSPVLAQDRSLLREFQPNATQYSEDNAYALAYLSAMAYPQVLARDFPESERSRREVDLRARQVFLLTEFMRQTADLVGPHGLDMSYVFACQPNGYDPEAIVIDTPAAVLVVFRGTDYVACALRVDGLGGEVGKFLYKAAEWIGSDFDISRIDFRAPREAGGAVLAPGKVHAGFWRSLSENPRSTIVSRRQLIGARIPQNLSMRLPSTLKQPVVRRSDVDLDALPLQLERAPRFAGTGLVDLANRFTLPQAATQSFVVSLEQVVRSYAQRQGVNKKIWVAGHSLGGAHAQLAGMYLKKRGLDVQGIYAFAGPNVAAKEFTDELRAVFPGHRLTRFIFAQDPIPVVATDKVGFSSSGRVAYFDDLTRTQFASADREVVTGGGALLRTVSGALSTVLPLESNLEVMCYHHPEWYVWATHQDLLRRRPTRASSVLEPHLTIPDRSTVPSADDPARRDRVFFPCTADLIARGRRKDATDTAIETGQGVVEAGLDAALNFTYDLAYALGNEIGNPAFEGVYTVVNYAALRARPNSPKLLDRDTHAINLSPAAGNATDNEFIIRRSGLGGYTIGRAGSGRVLTPKASGFSLWDNNVEFEMQHPRIEVSDCPWHDPGCGEIRRIPALEQTWRFYKLKEADNLFLLENRLTGKVADSNNACSVNAEPQCKVKQWGRRNNDATQLWVLRRVRGL
jgi:pimeloyl-ACP methyl ester carboxylesterase